MNNATNYKWVSFAIYYNNIDFLITQALVPFLETSFYKKEVSRFIFNKTTERGENLLLLFKVENNQQEVLLKENIFTYFENFLIKYPAEPKQIVYPINDWFLPFPSNHIEYTGNFLFDIMETGGLVASKSGEELLLKSSDIISSLISDSGEDWSPDNAIGTAIQMHLCFIVSSGMPKEDAAHFYDYMLKEILALTNSSEEIGDFAKQLLNGLGENFELQKESLVGYIEYIITILYDNEKFDEEWLNEWYDTCLKFNQDISSLQLLGQYFAPENFERKPEYTSAESIQEKWPIFSYYLRFINSQMGIINAYELNLVYSVSKSLQVITEHSNI